MWERTLSQKIVNKLCEQDVIDTCDAAAYVYGYELLISSVISVLIVVLVSIICGDFRYSLSFLLGFVLQRIYIGGYHATSHIRCYFAFSGMFLICVLLSKLIVVTYIFRIMTTALLLSISILFAPVEAKNKPLNEKKRLKYKIIASTLSAEDFIITLLNMLPNNRIVTCYYLSKWVLVIFAVGPLYQKIKPARTI